jgi:hypothetical protein
MKINPVIEEHKFVGSDKGLKQPSRLTDSGGFQLLITNFDRTDPPDYSTGDVPRAPKFNKNVFTISTEPKMPVLDVACEVAGFTPSAKMPIFWRLQTLQVLGRFKNVGNYHYKSRVAKLAGEWTGTSTAGKFQLFGADQGIVIYDNLDDRVCGGHALLTVACRVSPNGPWLQDYVHLRITGSNPINSKIRKEVANVVVGRTAKPLEHMLNAVFAWEASGKQFDSSVQTRTKFSGVAFDWPDDPANFPVAAFDFGIGLGQFTDPAALTTAITWDWRANLHAGANELFGKLRHVFKPSFTWKQWAYAGWRAYNGSGAAAEAYAKRLADSPDGTLVPDAQIPKGFNLSVALEEIEMPDPPPGKWPVGLEMEAQIATENHASEQDNVVAKKIAIAALKVTRNRKHLAWIWPRITENLHNAKGHGEANVVPGLDASELSAAVSGKSVAAVDALSEKALGMAWKALKPANRNTPLLATRSTIANEWNELIPFVRNNLGENGTMSDYAKLRDALFAHFGATGKPDLAIQRINAYYDSFVDCQFPRKTSALRVHAQMKERLDAATRLLENKKQSGKLSMVGGAGGFRIRPNANNHAKLSNHSFGVATDLDPEMNPNMPFGNNHVEQKPWADLVEFLTGTNPYGQESLRLRTPRTYDKSFDDVETICAASDAYVQAFKSLDKLAAAVVSGMQRLDGKAIKKQDAAELLTLAIPPTPSQQKLKAALTDFGIPSGKAAELAARLIYGRDVFERSKKPGLKPEITGTAATTAKFGFANLPAEVIASLAASDGGKLRWLGTATSTKDFMHFDFRDNEIPKPF